MALARRCLRQRAWCWRCLLQQRARLRRRALRWSRFVSAAASACAAHPRCAPLSTAYCGCLPSSGRCSGNGQSRAGVARSARSLKLARRSPMRLKSCPISQAIPCSTAQRTRLPDAMRAVGCFPPSVLQTVSVAEESGALDAMLNDIATLNSQQLDRRIEALAGLVEPLIIVVLGALIGGLVVALYLPIIQLGNVI